MRVSTAFCFLSLIGTLGISPVLAQTAAPNRARQRPAPLGERTQVITFHNPYTSGTVTADLLTYGPNRSSMAAVLITGEADREERAAVALAGYLTRRGVAVLKMPPLPANGASEEDNLNTLAALTHMRSLPEFRSRPIGLIGYGDGVRLAAVSASQSEPAFLITIGGALVPDRLNSLPDKLTRGTLPKDAAVQALSHIRCPILVLLGEYDGQGTHRAAAENTDALRTALDAGHHNNYTINLIRNTDSLLAPTERSGESTASSSGVPTQAVWKNVADWLTTQIKTGSEAPTPEYGETTPRKPTRLYPKDIYGTFELRPLYWFPTTPMAIGDQPRPFGFWYW